MSKTLKEINAAIASITKRGKALRVDCHKTLVDVIEHYIEHGDNTALPQLQNAVKDALGSSISAAMNDWISKFVPSLKWNPESKAFVHIPKVPKIIADVKDLPTKQKDALGKVIEFSGNGRDLPFYELEREVNQEPFDLQKAIMTLVVRAERALEANVKEHKHNVVNSAQVEVLKSLAKSIKDVRPDVDEDPQESTEVVPDEKVNRGRKAKAETPALTEIAA